MKKKCFKGFTLVECLIALAILGIGALVMAQIYANVSRINLKNHIVNTSLSYQMKLVEEQTASDRVEIYYGNTTKTADNHSINKSGDGAPPDQVTDVSVQKNYVQLTKEKSDGTLSTETYSFPVDIYVLLSRKADNSNPDNGVAMSSAEDKNINLRYRYLTGHSNS